MNCPFCNNQIDKTVFAISPNFKAIYNIAPVFPGHILIIPGRHITSLLDLTDDEIAEMMSFAKSITRLILREFKANSFNWSVQDKEAAGQTIAHLHMHIVPRHEGDMPDPGDWYPKISNNYDQLLDSVNRPKLMDKEMDKIVVHLRKEALKNGFTI